MGHGFSTCAVRLTTWLFGNPRRIEIIVWFCSKKENSRLVILLKNRSGEANDISECLMKEECSKMNIEEMKEGRPLFALLSNEMNRTRMKKRKSKKEREEDEEEGEENSAFVQNDRLTNCSFFSSSSSPFKWKEKHSGR